MRGLYEHDKIKAMVNISHGEGFGLPLFEAARLALPIISVGWSGQTDFLGDKFLKVKHELKPVQPQAVWDGVIQADSQWARLIKGLLKMALRQMYKKHGEFVKQAEQLQDYVDTKFRDEVLLDLQNSVLGNSTRTRTGHRGFLLHTDKWKENREDKIDYRIDQKRNGRFSS